MSRMGDEPTGAQIKEFWEWCSVPHKHIAGEGIAHYRLNDWYYGVLPIDLNNLFKYAVPELEHALVRTDAATGFLAEAGKMGTWWHGDKDPALALFWAIWEVIHADKD